MMENKKDLNIFFAGIVLGVLLSVLAVNFISSPPDNLLERSTKNILDFIYLPSTVDAEDKNKIISGENRSGFISDSRSMGEFDVYVADERLVIIKDKYVRGVFDAQQGVMSIFPRSNKALFGDGPFIYYQDSRDENDVSLLQYSNGADIYEDYWLDGIDSIRKRTSTPRILPHTLYSHAWRLNSYLSDVTIEGYDCVAIPLAGGVEQDALACCQERETGAVSLMHYQRPENDLESVYQPLTDAHVGLHEDWWNYWNIYADTRQSCIDNYQEIKNKSWHSFEPFNPDIIPADR